MKTRFLFVVAGWLALPGSSIQAQLVADGGTATINNFATNIAGSLTVGNSGSFTTLIITNQGTVTNTTTGVIGSQITARTNRVIVTGTNSVWANGATLAVGSAGSFNLLLITNGATVMNTFGNLGNNTGGSNNTVVVTGSNTLWSMSSTLNVGNGDRANRLVISNGGRVTVNLARLGNVISSRHNTAVVTGPGSSLSSQNELDVGRDSSYNELTIADGARVTSGAGYLGGNPVAFSSGSSNVVTVTGAGSVWTNTSTLALGYIGRFNQVTISNGGAVILTAAAADITLGNQIPSLNNTIVVHGNNSRLSHRARLILGSRGSLNRLLVTDGGRVESGIGVLGDNSDSSNNLAVVTGPGALWTNATTLYVGNAGHGNQLTVTNAGVVMASNLFVGFTAASSNNLVTVNGGSLVVTNAAGNAITDVRRGVLLLGAGSAQFDGLRVTNNSGFVSLDGGLLSARDIVASNGDSFVVGNFPTAATLELLGDGSHIFADGLIVEVNSTLKGNGILTGNVTNYGNLAVGSSVGRLVLNGVLHLAASSTNFFELDQTTSTNDNITGLSQVVYGGVIVVTNLSGSLVSGDRFQLFDAAAYSGSFASLVLPSLDAGLLWTNKLLVDGSIEIYEATAREFGVDVSHFQGESGVSQASWNQMFADGKKFAFIKATEGLTGPDDAAMFNNVTRATAAGLLAGVYHFAHPENRPTTNGAVQEADHFLSYAGNFIGPGYLRPVLDLEFNAAMLGTTELTDWVIAFCDRVIALRGPGAAPIIYCNQNFANNEFDSRLAGYDLWLRTVTVAVDPAVDQPPGQGFADPTGVFDNWSFWQYSATGSSGGISPLDLNVCHSEYQPLTSFVIPELANPVPPIITTQPQGQLVTLGSSAQFAVSISVTSSPALYYQWRFNDTNIAGANQPAYTRANVQAADAGAYTVVITNSAGSVTSAVATLTLFTPVTLYQENFDSYAVPSVVTSPGVTNGFKLFYGAASGPLDFLAQFGFDYASVTHPGPIPSAPHSGGTTRGLYLTVNKDVTGAAAAINLYPVSQVFTGSFALKFDVWLNWTNAATATEHVLFGINHSAAITNRIGQLTSDGLFFAMNGDGGSTSTSPTLRDYSVFLGGGSNVSPILVTSSAFFGPAPLLGAQFDNLNPGFTALFPVKSFAGFNTPAGSAGLGWVCAEVRQETNLITWRLNDVLVAQYTNLTSFTNGNLLIGYNDNFASTGDAHNFVIFDNLRVETVGPDYDGNGLLDQWEMEFFGTLGVNPDADADEDGASNGHEFLAGTNPTNAASVFQLLSASRTNNDLLVSWTTVGGRGYVLQWTADLAGGFADLSPVIAVSGSGEGSTNYLHVGGVTNQGAYYRVQLVP